MTDISALNEHGLEQMLSEPAAGTREVIAGLEGDIVVLGAGGKMGPTLAMMLRRASENKTIYAVSRFTDKAVKKRLDQAGVKTVSADLLDESCYRDLPVTENVYYLVGMKFGVTGNQPLTWALNSFLPGRSPEQQVSKGAKSASAFFHLRGISPVGPGASRTSFAPAGATIWIVTSSGGQRR